MSKFQMKQFQMSKFDKVMFGIPTEFDFLSHFVVSNVNFQKNVK